MKENIFFFKACMKKDFAKDFFLCGLFLTIFLALRKIAFFDM